MGHILPLEIPPKPAFFINGEQGPGCKSTSCCSHLNIDQDLGVRKSQIVSHFSVLVSNPLLL